MYELPWYIIIGAPGAGKTTTIVNSGLEFPFAAELGPKALRGAGGTRNCDWWFTSDAVLIDTAGRYTTQDSYREADRAAWLGFLQLLLKHRPRQPINGVILTLSATDLLQPDADKRRVLAREMRERIGELHAQLGIRFPIYVMVTKCDLLAGFAEFFADFDKDERAQVWGATLSLDAADGTGLRWPGRRPSRPAQATALAGDADTAARLARLSGEMVALEKSLHECLIARLHDERDRERRAALFGFPQQWRLLRDALAEMMRMTFESSSGGAAPLLRGVYFTSATQEGSPMDRALGALSRALGLAHRVLPPGRPSGRSYFVTRLLREVVLGEAGLAGTNRRWERQRAWLHGGVVAASTVLTVVALGWSWRQYAAQHRTARPPRRPRSLVCRPRRRRPRLRRGRRPEHDGAAARRAMVARASRAMCGAAGAPPAWASIKAATSPPPRKTPTTIVLREQPGAAPGQAARAAPRCQRRRCAVRPLRGARRPT